MKAHNNMISIPLLLMLLLVLMMVTAMGIMAAPQKVELGTAESFAILAGSGITVAGEVNSTEVYGDIGSYPTGTYTGEGNVDHTYGDVYLADGVALQAQDDLQTAYNDAFGRDSTMDITGLDLGNISSEEEPLLPGVYTADTSLGLTGTLYLHADNPNDAFIFQMDSTLTTASDSKIELSGEATFCQVFWQVGSSATLGSYSQFVGHILAYTDISVDPYAEVKGQLLALGGGGVGGAVTLAGNNKIINDVCLSAISTGSLAVTKNVTGDTEGIELPDFEITVTGPDGFLATRTFVDGDSFTWANLVPGTYTVTEGDLSSEWTVTGEGDVTVVADEIAVNTITNTYLMEEDIVEEDIIEQVNYGILEVTKIVSGDTGDMTLPLFEITVTGPANFTATRTFVDGETYTWENLAPGTYIVKEDKTGLSEEWTVTGEGSVQLAADETVVTTVTNSYVMEEDIVEEDIVEEDIVEEDIVEEDIVEEDIVEEDIVEEDIVEEDIVEEDVIEAVNYGTLEVTKIVSGDTGDMTLPLFEITVTGPEGFSATRTFASGETYTWANLVPGTYIVKEDKTGLSEEWTVTGEGSVQVVADQTAVTTVTNSYLAEARRPLPRTGGNELLLTISLISIALAGGLFLKVYCGDKEYYIDK